MHIVRPVSIYPVELLPRIDFQVHSLEMPQALP